jgi:hypothetical protein
MTYTAAVTLIVIAVAHQPWRRAAAKATPDQCLCLWSALLPHFGQLVCALHIVRGWLVASPLGLSSRIFRAHSRISENTIVVRKTIRTGFAFYECMFWN